MKKNRVFNGSSTEVTDSLFQNKKYQSGPSNSDCIHGHFHSSLSSMKLSSKQLAAPTCFGELKISACALHVLSCSHLFSSKTFYHEKHSILNFKIALMPHDRFYAGKDWDILLLKYYLQSGVKLTVLQIIASH